jgi:hypothetical protein
MGKHSGNRGEWSELYVLIKILADGRLYGADKHGKRTDDVYYDVNKVIRKENNVEIEYVISEDKEYIEVIIAGEKKAVIGADRIVEESEHLFDAITRSSSRTFSVARTELLMDELYCTKLKSPSSDKSDIRIQIHDHRTGLEPTLGFSIKSALGSLPTLVNSSGSTNVIFDLIGNMTSEIAEVVNFSEKEGDWGKKRITLSERYQNLYSNGIELKYTGTQNSVFEDNLRMIDSSLPEILAEMLKLHYVEGISDISEQIKILSKKNPLEYRKPDEYPYYEFKIKKLLVSYALGMRSSAPWKGDEQASGGYIIVKEDGDVLCYHLYNRNDFEDYLVQHTKLDTPSTTRHEYSNVYKTLNEKYRLKLNLQIRFK